MMNRKVFASYLIPLIVGMIAIDLLGFGFLNQLFFMMAFFWPFTMQYPGLHEKVQINKYRFSTMRLFFFFDSLFTRFSKPESPKALQIVLRGLAPILLLVTAKIASGTGNILFIFLGFIVFEICHYTVQKVFKGSFLEPREFATPDPNQLEMKNILDPESWQDDETKSDQDEN
jgi:hypothetical protein